MTFRAASTWVVTGAFLLALVSIGVVTTLQHRADKSRDAQVMLGQIERGFDALQSIPFDANGQGGAAQAAGRSRPPSSSA
jgi:hypothetical protein